MVRSGQTEPAMADAVVHLRNTAGDLATVSLYGGQVLSWHPAGQREQLYCSPLARRGAGHAIRGGVPLCFPQFADRGSLPKHGFARTGTWCLADLPEVDHETGVARAQLTLRDSAASQTLWPHGFRLELRVSLGPSWLDLALQVLNVGDSAFAFTGALHSYLAVADVRESTLVGLDAAPYVDSLAPLDEQGKEALVPCTGVPLQFVGETDRIYQKVAGSIRVQGRDAVSLRVEQTGFQDTVVWNPGPVKAAALGDMPTADWTSMLCVEAAQVAQPVRLQPCEHWLGSQRLLVADS